MSIITTTSLESNKRIKKISKAAIFLPMFWNRMDEASLRQLDLIFDF